jgi:hypothetical protein
VFGERARQLLERRRFREETNEYKIVSGGPGREVVEPTQLRPCKYHESWQPKRWLEGQPTMLEERCPFCLDERMNGPRRDLARERQAAEAAQRDVGPIVVQLDKGEAAWAEYKAAHPEEFISPEEELRAVSLIDDKRAEEMRWNRLSPEEKMRRRRKSHAKYWSKNALRGM